MEKAKYTIRLSNNKLNYIKQFAETNNITQTAALEQIITDHENRNQVKATELLADYIADALIEKLNPTLTRIRLAANNADRNSDVIVELLNGIYCFEDYNGMVLTTEHLHRGTKKAQDAVKTRIANYRQALLERERKKGIEADE